MAVPDGIDAARSGRVADDPGAVARAGGVVVSGQRPSLSAQEGAAGVEAGGAPAPHGPDVHLKGGRMVLPGGSPRQSRTRLPYWQAEGPLHAVTAPKGVSTSFNYSAKKGRTHSARRPTRNAPTRVHVSPNAAPSQKTP